MTSKTKMKSSKDMCPREISRKNYSITLSLRCRNQNAAISLINSDLLKLRMEVSLPLNQRMTLAKLQNCLTSM